MICGIVLVISLKLNFAFLLRTSTLLFILILPFALLAQERTITGKVTDAQTKLPLSSCSVYSLHSGNGVITNEDGTYNFVISDRTDSIAISMVGYIIMIKPVTKAFNQVINFEAQPAQGTMGEVVVEAKSKYTKAQRLVRKVIKNRDLNDVYANSNFQAQVYDKIELDVKNIPEKLQKNKLMKPFAFLLENMDSTKDNEKFLPIYLSESMANFYFKKNPEKERYDYIAIKSSGMDNKSMLTYVDALYKKVNVYDNYIKFVDINFISPISNDALNFYNYYIQDTLIIDNHRCIQVQFTPINYGSNTFNGNMWIVDTIYAVKSVVMHMNKTANINWVNKFEITQEFESLTHERLLPEKNILYVDLKVPAMKAGAIAKKSTMYKNFLINNNSIDTAFDKKPIDITSIPVGTINSDTAFWRENRFEPLSRTERSVYKMMDTLAKIPQVITYQKIISALSTGYYSVGKVDIGNLYTTFTSNSIEGTRFNIGAKTNYLWAPDYQLKGYIGASTRDKQIRYYAAGLFVLNRKPWSTLSFKYVNDIASTYEHSDELDENSVFSSFLRRIKSSEIRLVNNQEAMVTLNKFYYNGFGFKVSARNSAITPFFSTYYKYGNFLPYIITKPGHNERYKSNEVSLTLRYCYREKYITEHYRRGSLGSNYPIIALTYAHGIKSNNGWLRGDFDYHKWDLTINQDFTAGRLGQISYTVQGNMISGILPIVLLDVQKGNDTYYYNPYAFNNMNRFEFVSDKFVSLSFQDIIGSFPFNYFPLIKRLKWRSLITFKGVLGGMSEANKIANAYYDTTVKYHFYVPGKTPYMEAGVGVENILHLFRIDAVWRLTYRDNPDIPKFGIKGSVQLKF